MNYRYCLLGSILLSFHIDATTNQELFLHANKLYHTTQYQDAIDMYQKINNKTDIVWYNIGLCFYKQANYAYALWAFKKALKICRRKHISMIMKGIYKVENSLGRTVDNAIGDMIYDALRYITAGTSLLYWQVLFLFFLYLICGIYIVNIPRLWTLLITAIGFSLLGIIGGLGSFTWAEHTTKIGIVISQHEELLSGPYQDCHKECILTYAQEVTILESYDDWLKIKSNNMVGWVSKRSVIAIT